MAEKYSLNVCYACAILLPLKQRVIAESKPIPYNIIMFFFLLQLQNAYIQTVSYEWNSAEREIERKRGRDAYTELQTNK